MTTLWVVDCMGQFLDVWSCRQSAVSRSAVVNPTQAPSVGTHNEVHTITARQLHREPRVGTEWLSHSKAHTSENKCHTERSLEESLPPQLLTF
eukprot:4603868-Amphidinium_carterae.2